MSRAKARAYLMQMIFHMEANKDFSENEKNLYKQNQPAAALKDKYIDEIHSKIFANIEKIDQVIEKNAKGWNKDRFAKVDLAILRIAVSEIMFDDSIPISVSINEAVELGKSYGTEESGKFINGILAQIVKGINTNEAS